MFEGEWNNDKKNGEGTLVKRYTCEVITGDFRNDLSEGKQKYDKVLPKADIEKYFLRAIKDNQRFIVVNTRVHTNYEATSTIHISN